MGAVAAEELAGDRARVTPAGQRFYHPELDVLRFLAFLAVFAHHALPSNAAKYVEHGFSARAAHWAAAAVFSGSFGVDLFFILSSYLITELLLREYDRNGRLDVKSFYIRRALRIWPLYFAFIAFSAVVVPHIIPYSTLSGVYLLCFLAFVGNWACAFTGKYPPSVARPLWSVSVEEQFYIAWPLLLKTIGVRHIRALAIILLAIASGTRLLLAYHQAPFIAVWCNTFARLDPIAAGALLASALHGKEFRLSKAMRLVMTILGIALWIGSSRYLDLSGPTSLLSYPAITLGGILLLVAALRPMGSGHWPVLAFLGRISYGLYVFHSFILTWVNNMITRSPGAGTLLAANALALLLCCLMAICSYLFLELPFLRLKSKFTYVPSRPEGPKIVPTAGESQSKAQSVLP